MRSGFRFLILLVRPLGLEGRLQAVGSITEVKLADCTALNNLTLDSLPGLTHFSAPPNLFNKLEIKNCNNLTTCDLSEAKGIDEVVITGCPNLKKIILSQRKESFQKKVNN